MHAKVNSIAPFLDDRHWPTVMTSDRGRNSWNTKTSKPQQSKRRELNQGLLGTDNPNDFLPKSKH